MRPNSGKRNEWGNGKGGQLLHIASWRMKGKAVRRKAKRRTERATPTALSGCPTAPESIGYQDGRAHKAESICTVAVSPSLNTLARTEWAHQIDVARMADKGPVFADTTERDQSFLRSR